MQRLLAQLLPQTNYFWPLLPEGVFEVAVFGAGGRGRCFAEFLRGKGIRVACFYDNDRSLQGSRIGETPVLDPAEAPPSLRETPVVICSHAFLSIEAQLAALGFRRIYIDMNPAVGNLRVDPARFEAQCQANYDVLEDDESRRTYLGNLLSLCLQDGRYHRLTPYPYLDFPKARIAPGDVVLNAGGFFGDPAILYCKATNNACQVHTFEPNHHIFPIHCRRLKEAGVEGCVTPNCAGIWDSTGFMYLQDLLAIGDSKTSESHGETVIFVYTVDEYCRRQGIVPSILETGHVDLVKPILDGAEAVLRDHRPQFHFSVWPFSDVITRIKAIDERYRIYYTQHQSLIGSGGMLYAAI